MKPGRIERGTPQRPEIHSLPGGENNTPPNPNIEPNKKKSFPDTGLIRSITHPDLLAALIDGDRNVRILEDFISQEAEKIEQLEKERELMCKDLLASEVSLDNEIKEKIEKQVREQIYQSLLTPSNSLAEEINELIPRLSSCDPESSDLDLARMLRKRLAVSDSNPYESYAITKMLVSMQGVEGFLSDFVMPYLRKDEGLEKPESNYDFCIRLLKAQDELDKTIILNSIDYSSVSRFDEFSKSLLAFAKPDEILVALLKSSQKLLETHESNQAAYQDDVDAQVLDAPQASGQTTSHHIPLMIGLSVLDQRLEQLKKSKELNHHAEASEIEKELHSLAPQIKELYRLAPNIDILHQASEFLVNYADDSAEVFKDNFLNKENYQLKRFYAIGYYGWANKKYSTIQVSIPTLVDFIREEEDSYLIANACFMLGQCDTEGHDKLAEVIIDQIKNNKPSLPLAALTMYLIDFKSEPYLTIFKKVISAKYPEESGLYQAYKNLSDVKLQKIPMSEKQFTKELPRERPELLFELFREAGSMILLDLPESNLSNSPTDGDTEGSIQRKNLSDLLQVLSKEDLAKVRNVLMEAEFVHR